MSESFEKRRAPGNVAKALAAMIVAASPAGDATDHALVQNPGDAVHFSAHLKSRINHPPKPDEIQVIKSISESVDTFFKKYVKFSELRAEILGSVQQNSESSSESQENAIDTTSEVDKRLNVEWFIDQIIKIEINYVVITQIRNRPNNTRTYQETYGQELLERAQHTTGLLEEIAAQQHNDPGAFEKAVRQTARVVRDMHDPNSNAYPRLAPESGSSPQGPTAVEKL